MALLSPFKLIAADTNFDSLEALSNRDSIEFTAGVEAIAKLPATVPAISSQEEKAVWQERYNRVHNRLFILTHIARLDREIQKFSVSSASGPSWLEQGKALKIESKEAQKGLFRQALQSVSEGNFQHSNHQFNNMDDLSSALSVGLSARYFKMGFSSWFFKSVSKSESGGWMSGSMMSQRPTALFRDSDSIQRILRDFDLSEEDLAKARRLMENDKMAALKFFKSKGVGIDTAPKIKPASLANDITSNDLTTIISQPLSDS